MVDLKSIVSLDKIEDNLEWVGIAAGHMSHFGLQTPLLYAEAFMRDGATAPNLYTIRYHLLEHPQIGGAFKSGLLMAVGGAIGEKLLGGIGGRASRAAGKFGTGMVLGAALDAVLVSMMPAYNAGAPPLAASSGIYSP